jgi:tetratricopeptide (TPR) repeat protein
MYSYSHYNRQNRKLIKQIIILVSLIIIIVILVFSVYKLITRLQTKKTIIRDNINKVQYNKLFKEKNYIELITQMDIELKKNPFKQEYLVYRGYSYFLLGEDEGELTKKKKYLISSLIDLRKALAININEKNIADVYFCIGKIYFYLGESYYNQSLKFLNKSLEKNNKRKDLYYTLGVLYLYLGKYDDALKILFEASKNDNSDLLSLAIANTFYAKNSIENAKSYLNQLLNRTQDNKIKEKSCLLMGEILFKEKKYDEALEYFNKTIDLNENNPSAYFYRGEIYFIQNNLVKARAEWRKTLEIDPSHIKALKRIYY